MSYRDQLLDTDHYDDQDDPHAGDPRLYHDASGRPFGDQLDPKPYQLISRRFPEGVLVRRYYSIPGCLAQVVRVESTQATAYALPSELHPLL